MDTVFLLWHLRPAGPNENDDDEKLIGVYRTEEDAKAAIERVKSQPGFVDFPDGFFAEKYELGKDHWTEGFGAGSA